MPRSQAAKSAPPQRRHSPSGLPQPDFLPTSAREMDRLGWKELDVLLVSGDAYLDHPAFGTALLGRWLVHHGFRVGIAAQPRWDTPEDLGRMGVPRLFVGVSAGSLDSMLAHYTAFRKKRGQDAHTPGGRTGKRPNRAAIVYANLARRAFPGLPVILGGVEASLRRASHYDFWSDALRRSILLDSKATAILYGMAEISILELARGLEAMGHHDPAGVRGLLAGMPGAVHAGDLADIPAGREVLTLPSHEAIAADPGLLVTASLDMERQVRQDRAVAVQASGGRLVILNPPGPGLDGPGLDALYALPFSRRAHPDYDQPIPAEEMVRASIATHRGCAGGCSFCTLALHQGRRIRSRSRESVLAEAQRLAATPGWTGSVSDVGGPSANMWGAACTGDPGRCERASCLTPTPCRRFSCDQGAFVDLLRDVSRLDGVRHVRVASGWRLDLALADREALGRLVREFVGGQAKVAPEHCAPRVLKLMRKPPFAAFEEFLRLFEDESRKAGKRQYVIPYLMSAFPGCTDADMRQLAAWLGARGWKPQQVQCFIPLPGTVAAALYFAGKDPAGRPIPVARTDAERLRQHAILTGDSPREPRRADKSGPGRATPGRAARKPRS